MHSRVGLRGFGALTGALGVALAAYGSHGLKDVASEAEMRLWGIACVIQLLTAPVVLLVAVHPGEFKRTSGWLLLAGVLLFCGSLYAMALGGPRFLGAVAPLGGLSLILGWASMGLGSGERGGSSRG